MQWYNPVTRELTTVKPGKEIPNYSPNEINYEYWLSLYSDWEEVDNDFRPDPTLEQPKSIKLAEIKVKLAESDYKCLKYTDGDLTAEEYEPFKQSRKNLRIAYNTIEIATTIEEVNNVVIP